MGSRSLSERGNLGVATRLYGPDDDRTAQARRRLAEAKIADYIERVVAEAPPLTDDQRARLSLLLNGSAA